MTKVGLTAAFVLGSVPVTTAVLYEQVISTQYGDVQGTQAIDATQGVNISDWESITAWRGIPFAASTAGANRWRSPQPPTSWSGTLDAGSFGPICPSVSLQSSFNMSEDCLSINIWSAANSTDAKLPVMLWSYGLQTTAASTSYDGAGIASKGVVFVSYNYREGAFGYLAHPDLQSEDANNSTGNYGLLDQVAALEWVYNNIDAFGGDPEQITLAGHSAGAAAVMHLSMSPLTKGRFKAGIVQSAARDPCDPLIWGLPSSYRNLSHAIEVGETFLTDHNVTTIGELRNASMESILDGNDDSETVSNPIGYSPPLFRTTLDGYAMPSTYLESLSQAPITDVPFIIGGNSDEDGASPSSDITVADYLAHNDETYTIYADEFTALYPANNDSQATDSYNEQYRALGRVSYWSYGNRYTQYSNSSIWTYYWDHAPPGQTRGAYHGAEISYALNNLYAGDTAWEDVDYEIADTLSEYWANFVKHHDPNGGSLVAWEPMDSTTNTTFRVGNAFEEISVAEPAQIELMLEYMELATPDPW